MQRYSCNADGVGLLFGTRDVRDRDQKNYTLPRPGPKEKLYRDQNRDHDRERDQRLNPRLYDGLNCVNFCASEVTLFEKKSRKVLVVD
jgi:hypothetical protein